MKKRNRTREVCTEQVSETNTLSNVCHSYSIHFEVEDNVPILPLEVGKFSLTKHDDCNMSTGFQKKALHQKSLQVYNPGDQTQRKRFNEKAKASNASTLHTCPRRALQKRVGASNASTLPKCAYILMPQLVFSFLGHRGEGCHFLRLMVQLGAQVPNMRHQTVNVLCLNSQSLQYRGELATNRHRLSEKIEEVTTNSW